MNKYLLFFVTLIFCSTGSLLAKKIYVNDNSTTGDIYTSAVGNAANNGTTTATPKLTFAQAFTVAAAGDTIYIDKGTFNENTINGANTM